jgi:hypothetical protein
MRRSAAGVALSVVSLGCNAAGARAPAWNAPPEGEHAATSGTQAERYFPLVDGSIYLYGTTDEAGGQGVLIARVHRAGDRHGELRFPAGVKRFEYTPEGVLLAGKEAFVLKEPIAVGTSWTGEHGGRAQIVAVDVAVEVPAGRFAGCVQTLEDRLGDQPVRYVVTFCPEVGVVQLEAMSRASYEKAELKSYGPPMDVGPDGVQRFQIAPPPP